MLRVILLVLVLLTLLQSCAMNIVYVNKAIHIEGSGKAYSGGSAIKDMNLVIEQKPDLKVTVPLK